MMRFHKSVDAGDPGESAPILQAAIAGLTRILCAGAIRSRHHSGVALLLSALMLSSAASAQEPNTFVGGAGVLSSRSSDPPCTQGSGCSQPDETGTAWGIGLEFRHNVTPAVSVGIEATIPQALETMQHTGIPNARYDVIHRDLIVSGIVGVHAPRTGVAQLAIVGGASLIQERFSKRATTAPFGSSAFPPFSDPVATQYGSFALLVGADLDLAVARHVSLAPQLRVHWILTKEQAEGIQLGLGSVVWRPAVALRVHF